eukprot:3743383-Rhodomonas_salina.6
MGAVVNHCTVTDVSLSKGEQLQNPLSLVATSARTYSVISTFPTPLSHHHRFPFVPLSLCAPHALCPKRKSYLEGAGSHNSIAALSVKAYPARTPGAPARISQQEDLPSSLLRHFGGREGCLKKHFRTS